MDRTALKTFLAVIGVIGGVLLAIAFGGDVESWVGVVGGAFTGTGFLSALL